MRVNSLAALTILVLLVVPVSAQRNKGVQSRRLSLEEEARQEATKYWNRVLTQCGDSYYTKMFYQGEQEKLSPSNQGYWIYHFKGISIKTEGQRIEQHLTETDILNGVRRRRPGEGTEWSGRATLSYRVARLGTHGYQYPPLKINWSEWTNYTVPNRMVNFDKTDGKWQFFPQGTTQISFVSVKCDLSDAETAGTSR